MRNEAPVIVLAEWAAQVNAETRTCMGVAVAPEIPERQEARAYLAGFMSDEEAAACVAADLERVDQRKFAPISDDAWSAPSWHAAAVEYQKDRGNRPLIVEIEPERLAQARRLLADDVSLERAYAELSRTTGLAASTIMAAEYLAREGDAEHLRQWLDRRSAKERKAIQKYLGGKHAAKPRTDR